jgi:hypothetical protein
MRAVHRHAGKEETGAGPTGNKPQAAVGRAEGLAPGFLAKRKPASATSNRTVAWMAKERLLDRIRRIQEEANLLSEELELLSEEAKERGTVLASATWSRSPRQ